MDYKRFKESIDAGVMPKTLILLTIVDELERLNNLIQEAEDREKWKAYDEDIALAKSLD